MNDALIQKQYDLAAEAADRLGPALPDYCHEQTRLFRDGMWRDYRTLLERSSTELAGRCVVDFGCKYGHLAPLVKALGASRYIGVDAEPDYIAAGRQLFASIYPETEFSLTREGLIDLQPGVADFVLMNEVISHVNPAYLDNVWRESSRILRPRGVLFISDGNNAGNPNARQKLRLLYATWESAPSGTRTDRDTVTNCFLDLRRRVIRSYGLPLSEEQVEYAALNTSGLYGRSLRSEVERYAVHGELNRRPYVDGMVPVNPGEAGVVMERGFRPEALEIALSEYGFDARQIVPKPDTSRPGMLGAAINLLRWLQFKARCTLTPQWHRTAYEGFQIRAVKPG